MMYDVALRCGHTFRIKAIATPRIGERIPHGICPRDEVVWARRHDEAVGA